MDDLTVIIDTREQNPWKIKHHTTAVRKLDTGDYSIEGYEDIICIERKQSISEFVNNMSEKRFKDVLGRMQSYKYKYMIFEFTFSDVLNFPIGSSIPRKVWSKLRISPNYIIKYMSDILTIYGIPIMFCDSAVGAEKLAMSLMRRAIENEKRV